MGSYYINGPRIYTPSALKTAKSYLPIESFGPLPRLDDLSSTEPIVVNTCHATRGCALQQSHPYTAAHLRKVEMERTAGDAGRADRAGASGPPPYWQSRDSSRGPNIFALSPRHSAR